MIKEAIVKIVNKEDLSYAEAYSVMNEIKNADWYYTPITKHADMTFVSSLPKTEVQMNTIRTAEGYVVTLTNNSDVISYQNILSIEDGNGEVIVPAYWSDNFVTVLPGEVKTITCKVSKDGTIEAQTWNTEMAR